MHFERILMSIILFVFTIFFFGDIETAITGIAVEESLKPLFSVFPVLFIGSLFIALFYLGFKD